MNDFGEPESLEEWREELQKSIQNCERTVRDNRATFAPELIAELEVRIAELEAVKKSEDTVDMMLAFNKLVHTTQKVRMANAVPPSPPF